MGIGCRTEIMMPFNKSIDILGVGNTIVDLEYHVHEDQLTALQVEKGRMMLIDRAQKESLMQALGAPIHRCSGGSVSNSVFTASQFGQRGHHLGVVGSDELGQFTRNDYLTQGIGHSFDTTSVEGDTACCLVLITPDGERTMLTYLGVSADFSKVVDHESVIRDANVVMIEGYLLTDDTAFESIESVIWPVCQDAGANRVLTLSDAGVVEYGRDRFLTLLSAPIHALFCNQSEAQALARATDPDHVVAFFRDHSVEEVVITDGAQGVTVITDTDVIQVPTSPVKAVDTTGAGDAFAGTYIANRHQMVPIHDACVAAHRVAGTVVGHYGARPE